MIIDGPIAIPMSAMSFSGICLPFDAATSTSFIDSRSSRKSRAYRTRTGNRCRPSIVYVRFFPPIADSITS